MANKINIMIRKDVSKKGNTYLGGSIKVGDFARRDYFFPNALAVSDLTGMTIQEIEDAKPGVLFDKDLEV